MSRTALDTSVVVAGLLTWHERHPEAYLALSAVMGRGRSVVLPIPTLVESYAVMTRLPAPHRLGPADAFAILEGSFRKKAEVVGIDGRRTWTLLEELSDGSVAGGRTYDALILACALKARADRLLTLNPRDFTLLAEDKIRIETP